MNAMNPPHAESSSIEGEQEVSLVGRRPLNARERAEQATGWVVAAVVALVLLFGLGPS